MGDKGQEFESFYIDPYCLDVKLLFERNNSEGHNNLLVRNDRLSVPLLVDEFQKRAFDVYLGGYPILESLRGEECIPRRDVELYVFPRLKDGDGIDMLYGLENDFLKPLAQGDEGMDIQFNDGTFNYMFERVEIGGGYYLVDPTLETRSGGKSSREFSDIWVWLQTTPGLD